MKYAFLALLAIGCATAVKQQPPLQFERPLTTMREANALGAPNIPTARMQLQLASEQLEAARTADTYAHAARLIARAQADADVALAIAQENAANRELKTMTDELTSLRGGR